MEYSGKFTAEAGAPQLPSVYRLAYLQTWSASGAAAAAKRALLAAKKSTGTAQEQQTRLFRLALSCGREQRLRAVFGSRNPLSRELTFSVPEAEHAFTAIGKQNTTQRIILYLYYNEDYSMAEIAALLRRSEGAVSRTLQKAQVALKAELGEQDWKALLQGMFAAIQPEESLRAEVETALAQGKTGRSPAVKYAAVGALALVVVIAFVAAPLLESRPAQKGVSQIDGAAAVLSSVSSATAKPEQDRYNVRFTVFSAGWDVKKNTEEIILSEKPKELPTNGGGSVFGKDFERLSFNLHTLADERIAHVIYTGEHCSFVKVAFLPEKLKSGSNLRDYFENGFQGEDDGTGWLHWGYTSVGNIYGADYLEQINEKYYGLQIYYPQSNGSADDTIEERLKKSEWYDKAYITVEIKMEDGTTVTKKIQFGHTAETGALTARVAEDQKIEQKGK